MAIVESFDVRGNLGQKVDAAHWYLLGAHEGSFDVVGALIFQA
jgi:hypothetical protein